MATPRPVSKKFREMLGMEAADTMVEWLDGLETNHDALGQEPRGEIMAVRQEMAALRQDMATAFSELRAEMRAGLPLWTRSSPRPTPKPGIESPVSSGG